MLNVDEFINRIDELMKEHQLNASSLADKIGVQRSSLSHILSKRNKPSLDFILKINENCLEKPQSKTLKITTLILLILINQK